MAKDGFSREKLRFEVKVGNTSLTYKKETIIPRRWISKVSISRTWVSLILSGLLWIFRRLLRETTD